MNTFAYLCLPVLLLPGVLGQSLCTDCYCTVSEPETEARAVHAVKPRCDEGSVTWMNPSGALRMELKANGESSYCLRIVSDNANTLVYQEVQTKIPGNYRLKIVNNVQLRLSPLFSTRGQGKEYCIPTSGPMHLYIETERSDEDKGMPRVRVYYDREKTSTSLRYNPMAECRPCTDEELLEAFCSSDFVAVGTMDDIGHQEDLSSIRVSVTKLISQKEAVFRKLPEAWRKPHEVSGVVHAPVMCGIRRGEGHFLFTGRVRLGQPLLQCAPRYEQWKPILEHALSHDLLDCSNG